MATHAKHAVVAVGAALALWALACTKSGTDSTTHWLENCSSDADCGGLVCVCGVCTQRCDRDEDCSALNRSAECGSARTACAERTCVEAARDGGDEADARTDAAPGLGEADAQPSEPSGQGEPDAAVPADAAAPPSTAGASGAAGDGGSGAPWYASGEVCPGRFLIEGGGRSLSSCTGDCTLDLRLSPTQAADKRTCESVWTELKVTTAEGGGRTHFALLSADAWARLATLSIALEPELETIRSIGECHPCPPVDMSSLKVLSGGPSAQYVAYQRGDAPLVIREADAFVQTVIDDMLSCAGPSIVDCRMRVQPPVIADLCRFSYSNAQFGTTCEIELSVAAPCRAAARCLCMGGILEPGTGRRRAGVRRQLADHERCGHVGRPLQPGVERRPAHPRRGDPRARAHEARGCVGIAALQRSPGVVLSRSRHRSLSAVRRAEVARAVRATARKKRAVRRARQKHARGQVVRRDDDDASQPGPCNHRCDGRSTRDRVLRAARLPKGTRRDDR